MNSKKKTILVLTWFILVFLAFSTISYCKTRTKSYKGMEIIFEGERGYSIFIEGESDEMLVPFKARSLSPFMIACDNFYYLSSWWDSEPIFDSYDKAYQYWVFQSHAWWDGPEEGLRSISSSNEWAIVEGSSEINFKFFYEEPITIRYFPWKSTIRKTISTNLIIGLVAWAVPVLHLVEFKKEEE